MTEHREAEKRSQSDYERFVEKAKVSAAIVTPIDSFDDAVAYVVELIGKRPLTRYSIDDEPVRTEGLSRIVAAPALGRGEYELLEKTCLQILALALLS